MSETLTPCDVKSWMLAINDVCRGRLEIAFELLDKEVSLEEDREIPYTYDHWYVDDDNTSFVLVGYNHKFDGSDNFDVDMSYFMPISDIVVADNWSCWRHKQMLLIADLQKSMLYTSEDYEKYLEYKKHFEPNLPSENEWKETVDCLSDADYLRRFGVSRGVYRG